LKNAWEVTALSSSNRLFLATTLSFLSSRADDLACGEVMKPMNKTRSNLLLILFNLAFCT
jgi:hypothetical protein